MKLLIKVEATITDQGWTRYVDLVSAFPLVHHHRAGFGTGLALKIAFDRATEGVVCSNPVKGDADLAKSWDWARRTVLGPAMDPIRRLKSAGLPDLGRKPTACL